MAKVVSENQYDSLSLEKTIDLLTQERYELRSIGLEFQKAMRTSFFTFLGILVSIGTLCFKPEILPEVLGNDKVKNYVLIFLSQAEVVLAFFVMSQLTVQSSTSTYGKMVEDTINSLSRRSLVYFESVAMQRLVNSGKAAHFWSMLFLVLLLCSFFAACMIAAMDQIKDSWFRIVTPFEIVAIFCCVFGWIYELQKGTDILKKELKRYEERLGLKPR